MNNIDSVNPLGPLSRRALRHHVVQSLLKSIVRGELAAGTHLVTSKLAARLGVSATPIREALVELEQSGVVELLHHRGAVVRPFGRMEVQDFYSVRGLLECEAVRLASPRVEPEALGTLRSELEQVVADHVHGRPCVQGARVPDMVRGTDREKWVKEFLAVDQCVHRVFVEHCPNQRLIAEVERYHTLGEAMRDIVADKLVWNEESITTLLDLLDAVERRQGDAGAAAMRRHIAVAAEMVEQGMFDGS